MQFAVQSAAKRHGLDAVNTLKQPWHHTQRVNVATAMPTSPHGFRVTNSWLLDFRQSGALSASDFDREFTAEGEGRQIFCHGPVHIAGSLGGTCGMDQLRRS
ncbi:MAG: hypothetical protein WCO08_05155 [Actinomycetes bacterium]